MANDKIKVNDELLTMLAPKYPPLCPNGDVSVEEIKADIKKALEGE